MRELFDILFMKGDLPNLLRLWDYFLWGIPADGDLMDYLFDKYGDLIDQLGAVADSRDYINPFINLQEAEACIARNTPVANNKIDKSFLYNLDKLLLP